jgi:hypothetical protein
MTTEPHTLTVSGLHVSVVRKAIKNLHLGVYPPDGRVRVAAPLAVSDAAVRVAVIGKLRWIKRQQAGFEHQPRESRARDGERREPLLPGPPLPPRGRRDRRPRPGRAPRPPGAGAPRAARVDVPRTASGCCSAGTETACASTSPGSWRSGRPSSASRSAEWGIKRMKTKWGSCNPKARRIWLNLELDQEAARLPRVRPRPRAHPPARSAKHDDRFLRLMDRHLPSWRRRRAELNATPLAKVDEGHEPQDTIPGTSRGPPLFLAAACQSSTVNQTGFGSSPDFTMGRLPAEGRGVGESVVREEESSRSAGRTGVTPGDCDAPPRHGRALGQPAPRRRGRQGRQRGGPRGA